MKIFPGLLFLILSLHSAQADYFTKFIRYRCEPEFSRITINWETLRGRRGVDHYTDNHKAYERKGYYYARDSVTGYRKIIREEEMDGHTIQTVIHIRPPRGNGYDGANSHCSVEIYFDGILRAVCPIGNVLRKDFDILQVAIHVEEQIIEVFKHCDTEYSFIEHSTKEECLTIK